MFTRKIEIEFSTNDYIPISISFLAVDVIDEKCANNVFFLHTGHTGYVNTVVYAAVFYTYVYKRPKCVTGTYL